MQPFSGKRAADGGKTAVFYRMYDEYLLFDRFSQFYVHFFSIRYKKFSAIIDKANAIKLSPNYTQQQKDSLKPVTINNLTNSYFKNECYTHIWYEINFTNSFSYAVFKNANSEIDDYTQKTEENLNGNKEIITINNFFTTTTKVIKDPMFDCIAQTNYQMGKSLVDIAENLMLKQFKSLWSEIKVATNFEQNAKQFSYSYIVPTARVHTNADQVVASNGYYYHTWKINADNLDESGNSIIHIEYWTVTANRAIWYILTLLASAVIIGTTITFGIIKEKKQKNKFNPEE